MSLNNSNHGEQNKKLQTVQLAYDDNSEDTLRLHNQQQQQQKAGQEWDNWEHQPMMGGGPRNVRIVSIENEQLLNQSNQNQQPQQPNNGSNSLENPLYKVGLKLNKKQAGMLKNNGYQSPPENYDDGKLYTRKRRSLCCKLSVVAAVVCLLILVLGLAIGIPVSHKKGKIVLPKDNQTGTAQVRDSNGNVLSAEQLQQAGVVETAHDVCCPDQTCEVGYPGYPVEPMYTLRIQAFGQNATTNSTPSVLIGPGSLDGKAGQEVDGLRMMFYPYYHNPDTKEGQTKVSINYDPETLDMTIYLENRILRTPLTFTLDETNGTLINGAQLRLCLRNQQQVSDNLNVLNYSINGTQLGNYPGRAQGSCEEYYFSGRFYQGFNASFLIDYGLTSNLKDLNQVEIQFFRYETINAEVCAFTIGNVQGQGVDPASSTGDSTVQDTVQNSNEVLNECGTMHGCIGYWDLDVCLKGTSSLSTATNDLNNQFGKAISDWNISGCITIKQKDNATAVQQEVCKDACADEEEIIGLRMTIELGNSCDRSLLTNDLYEFFKSYESNNSASNFGGCEPDIKRVSFNTTAETANPHSASSKKSRRLFQDALY